MHIPAWLVISLFSAALLFIMAFHIRHTVNVSSQMQKMFLSMIALAFVAFAADCVSQMYRVPGVWFQAASVCTYLKFILIAVGEIVWMRYVNYLILDRVLRGWVAVSAIFFAAVLVVTLYPPLSRHLFYFDAWHNYSRGPLFLFVALLMFGYATAIELFVLYHRRKIERQYLLSLCLFTLPPLLGAVLQDFFYGVPFVLVGVTFSLLFVFVYIQSRAMDIDSLTGISNRRQLDIQIQRKIDLCSGSGRTFSAVLIDLDHFKSINDTFGHCTGDAALRETAALLKRNLSPADFAARYGGDEFCVLLESSDPGGLEVFASQVRDDAARLNRTKRWPFQLSFSMGYAVYDAGGKETMEAFQHRIDQLMYENKRHNHQTQIS